MIILSMYRYLFKNLFFVSINKIIIERFKFIRIAIYCFLLFFLSPSVYAQSNHYIRGRITDNRSAPLFGANVILTNTYQGAMADSLGNYRIDNIEPGKYTIMVTYIGYKSQEIELYISEYEAESEEDMDDTFSAKLGVEDSEEEDALEDSEEGDMIRKEPFYQNLNFFLETDALEIEQVVVSASKKKEKLIDAPITIAAVSEKQIRKTAGGDLGTILKTVRGVEVYQAGMGRTALNVRGFMSAFNGRFVSLVDGANYMEPTFYIAYGNTLPFVNEDIERLEVVFGPSSALYGPNAHNGLLNIITKHPRDSQGSTIAYSSGTSGYTSYRARFAKSIGKLGFKFSLANMSVLDWKYPRNFSQDYNLDGEITDSENHESVIFWDFIDTDIPRVWDDKNGDGEWDHQEEMTVMASDFERQMKNLKANLFFYYDISPSTEISFGHEHYYQSGYQPFDSGLNFINYTMGSLWTKIISKTFFGRLHWLRSTGTEYWNSDGAYLNMMRRDLTLKESVDKTKISDFVTTDVLRGDFQTSFEIKNIDFITGVDFAFYRPVSNRQFLDDRGAVSLNENKALADSVIGEVIEVNEYGGYLQATIDLPLKTKFVTAIRYDKHEYYESRLSPRFALQWNGLKSGNLRFSYNRAFQTPSIFNLHMLKYFDATDSGNIVPFMWDDGVWGEIVVNVNNPGVQQQIGNGGISAGGLNWVPLQTQFRGNRDGFTIDESIVVPSLDIETVDSYELGLKKLFFEKLFLDVSGFYSEYKNFISPLRIIHDFYPSEHPYVPEQVTHIGENYISNFTQRNSTVVYSYTSTAGASVYGLDLMAKYTISNNIILSTGLSAYGNLTFDSDGDASTDLDMTNLVHTVKNDTLKYFIENSLRSYSYQPGKLFFNAPTKKGFLALSFDGILSKKLWAQLSANYTEKFDFVSGYHVATINTNYASLSPNKIYENKGPIGGGFIFDLHLEYTLNNRVRFKMQLNNLLDQDGPRVVGTPPLKRNAILEVIFNYL